MQCFSSEDAAFSARLPHQPSSLENLLLGRILKQVYAAPDQRFLNPAIREMFRLPVVPARMEQDRLQRMGLVPHG